MWLAWGRSSTWRIAFALLWSRHSPLDQRSIPRDDGHRRTRWAGRPWVRWQTSTFECRRPSAAACDSQHAECGRRGSAPPRPGRATGATGRRLGPRQAPPGELFCVSGGSVAAYGRDLGTSTWVDQLTRTWCSIALDGSPVGRWMGASRSIRQRTQCCGHGCGAHPRPAGDLDRTQAVRCGRASRPRRSGRAAIGRVGQGSVGGGLHLTDRLTAQGGTTSRDITN